MIDKFICVILNYNNNKNALFLKQLFEKNMLTFVVDSGSDIKQNEFLLFDNIYYSGGLNEGYKLMNEYNKEYIIFICSDVTIDRYNYARLINKINISNLPKDFGVYSPSTIGKCHAHCKHQRKGVRKVPFVEGFFFLTQKKILDCFLPIDLNINKLGWGLDVAKGYYTEKNNLFCYIDDNIIIRHPAGTGYSSDNAMIQFKNWAKSINDKQFLYFIRKYMNIFIE